MRAAWDRIAVAVISLCGLWPFVPALLRGEVPGQREVPIDGAHGLYIYALVGEALGGNVSLVHNDLMWYPTGRPFLLLVQNVIDAVLAQPFLALFGPQLGLAAFAAAVLVGNGLAGGWLGERVGGRGWAGPSAAAVLALSPYFWAEEQTGRITQTFAAPMVLALGYAWTAAVDGRRGGWVGFWLGCAGLAYWFYGSFGAAVVGAVFLGGLVEDGAPRATRLRALAVAAGVSLLLAAPFAAFNAAHWQDMAGVGFEGTPVPNGTRLGGGWFWLPHPRIVVYIPQALYVVGVLACLGRPRGRALGLVVVTVLLCMTAVGEEVRIFGQTVPTPLAAMRALPGFSRFWWPARALAGATVALAALAAVAVSRGGWVRAAAGVGLLLALAQGAGVPGVLSGWRVPDAPEWPDRLRPGAVLGLPMLDPVVGKIRFAQWVHHRRPFVNGMSMWDEYLWTNDWKRWAEQQPLVQAMLVAERARPAGRPRPGPTDPAAGVDVRLPEVTAADVQALADQGVVGIVAERPRVPKVADELLVSLLGPPTCGKRTKDCWWALPSPTR